MSHGPYSFFIMADHYDIIPYGILHFLSSQVIPKSTRSPLTLLAACRFFHGRPLIPFQVGLRLLPHLLHGIPFQLLHSVFLTLSSKLSVSIIFQTFCHSRWFPLSLWQFRINYCRNILHYIEFFNFILFVAFMCSTGYARSLNEHNEFMELLPVAPVHEHPKANRRPVYFSEVIIRKEKAYVSVLN